ncbi:transposase [Polaribacter sp.]|uniref:transposase n=1 Tax=Polaribacter sp. TaxID=1920175 RepID=UPI003EF7CBE9
MEKYDVLEPGHFYHIYNRGNNKENLFVEDSNYSHFLNLIKKHISPIADVYAYCLLKNHFHLLIKIKSSEELSSIKKINLDKLSQPFSNLFNAYTKAINKKYNREGSLFKVRFKRNRITDLNYLRNVNLYIHLNPLKHSFTENYQEYLYSSYKSILSSKPIILKREEVIELFDDKDNFIHVHKENEQSDNFKEIE